MATDSILRLQYPSPPKEKDAVHILFFYILDLWADVGLGANGMGPVFDGAPRPPFNTCSPGMPVIPKAMIMNPSPSPQSLPQVTPPSPSHKFLTQTPSPSPFPELM